MAWSGYVGENMTNNEAEWRGVVAALALAERLVRAADEAVLVQTDSRLVVEQLAGTYAVRHAGLRRWWLLAAASLDRLRAGGRAVTVAHVRREQNRAADAMATDAILNRRSVYKASCAPAFVQVRIKRPDRLVPVSRPR